MKLSYLKSKLNSDFFSVLESKGLDDLRPCQEKAIDSGLLTFENILVCSPTASGKTLVAEIAALQSILTKRGKAIYIVPLKALATEKYNEFTKRYGHLIKIGVSIGDTDSSESYLSKYDLVITTSEKLDSLIRHHTPFLDEIFCVIIDEIHLLNDTERGPTLEIVITILRELLKNIQLIGLSATIGNEKALSDWLGAKLVHDTWRPVELHEGIIFDDVVEFY
ncbi:DEAD/DEAH box helicase [Candidatus Woesearchaeota archaeon]|nr:DEAD/DEAH box helicase [Candidatus Woesearchaeota archaeon]